MVPARALAADDLVVLEGDPAPLLQGTHSYARVYINSTLRLIGNTSLNVDSLYIGPRAQIQTCWVPDPVNPLDAGDPNGCVNGRSFAIRSRGPVQVAPAISLQGGHGAARVGGTLLITGTAITLGGTVTTQGVGGAPSGSVTLSTGGALRFQAVDAPGAAVSLAGGRGVSSAAEIDARPYNGGPHAAGHAAGGGAVTVNAGAGNVSLRGGVFTDGADAGGPGLYGGNAGRVVVLGGDVRVANILATGGSTENVMGGAGGAITVTARGRTTLGTVASDGGDSGANGRGGNAAPIAITSARKGVIDSVTARGAGGGRSGGAGGSVRVRGTALVITNLNAGGGNGNGAALNPPGGAGGHVDVAGSGRVLLPAIGASGGNGAGTGAGAPGGSVSASGARLLVQGGIGVSGGDGNGGRGGLGGSIALATSTGSLRVLGGLDASGSTSTQSFAGAGGRVTVTARGPALIVGQVGVQGANGAFGGSPGGRATLRAPSFQFLSGFGGTGGNATQPGRAGGKGAVIDIGTAGPLDMGSLSVAGGNGTTTGPGGGGGSALVAAAALQLSGGVDVTGGTSPNGNAGATGAMSLRIGGPVTVAGTLDASGTSSANASASAGGRVALTVGGDGYVGGINVSGGDGRLGGAPAGQVVLRGANVDVGSLASAGGNGVTSASGGRGGAIDIVTTGDFTTFGALAPVGGSGSGTGSGGPGGSVSLVSDDLSVGGVDVTGGNPGGGAGGPTGRVKMVAFGDLNVQGNVDAGGTGAGGTAPATDAGTIYLRAGNVLTAGTISVSGANGGTRGSRGSRLDLIAHDATIDAIFGDGGSASGAGNPPGGAGGLLVARLTGRLDVGALSFRGGNGNNRGLPGAGGSIDASAHDIDAASASTGGGSGGGRGGFGGPVRLDADNDLTVLGEVRTDGAQGAGAVGTGPGAPGGNAGRVTLRAGEGTLVLAQGVTAFGGRGGDPGGGFIPGAAGGTGGAVNVVARHVGGLEGIETNGGDGSGPQDNAGPGGNGGLVRVWSDDGVLDGSKFVASSGGNGLPGGLEGMQTAEQSPADVTPSKKSIAFTLRSPDASRVGLLATNGPQAGLVVSSAGVAGPLKPPKPLPCVAVRYAVVGVAPPLEWTSNPGAFVRGKAAKSKSCRKAAKVAGAKKMAVSLAAIAAGGFQVRVGAKVAGLGTAKAEAMLGKASLGSAVAPVLRKGRVAILLQLPPALRHPGTYQIRLSGHALVGRKTTTTTITLEVRP